MRIRHDALTTLMLNSSPTEDVVIHPALEVRDLHKGFGGVPVLQGVSLSIPAGHVAALAGENGAGKSTLMKIVTGQLRAESGTVRIAGLEMEQGDPGLSHRSGVAIVPQELAPYMNLCVYENLFVGRELRNRIGGLDRGEMRRRTKDILARVGLELDADREVSSLPVAVIQLLEIAKATSYGAKVILLDEPTSSIAEREVERLYAVVRQLRDSGVAMLYTTHRMEEIQRLADSVVVLRDGKLVLDRPLADTTPDSIVNAMVGRELEKLAVEHGSVQDRVRLSVRGLSLGTDGPKVSLQVRAGEIVGIGGLVGAGRTELVEAIYGMRKSVAGEIALDGQTLRRGAPGASIAAGVAFVPEDRKLAGLVLSRSVLDNGSLPHLSRFSRLGWIRGEFRRSQVGAAMQSVNLKSRGLPQLVGTLSGGNQQKIVLARWLTQNVNVLVLDEPTRGVDVGARAEIYAIIRRLAGSGMAVLLVSSDMPELIALSHRVLVMRGGAVVGELTRSELDAEDAQVKIFNYASGHKVGAPS